MNRDIFINQSTYVVGQHDVELQDGCWCGHHYKKVVRPKNKSIGSYINTRDASMWTPLVHGKIREFLGALTTGLTYGLLTAEMESQTFVPILMPTPL
jgi:hypothetical protein